MKIVLIALIMAVSLALQGQTAKPELISSSGGTFVTANQQISWSLGEAIIESFTSGNIRLSQGFHQCSYLITGVGETLMTGMEIKVFPNPAADFVTVQIADSNPAFGYYVITLTDLLGKQLVKFKTTSNCPQVDLYTFGVGTYFLTVSSSDQVRKTFKIIKSE